MTAVDIRSMTLSRLQQHIQHELGLPRYRAQQVFAWVHGRGVTSTAPMTTISKGLRAQLSTAFDLRPLAVDRVQSSADGAQKLLLRCTDGALVETVLIPHEDRLTQCLSSQVGCALGCRFCATAAMGFVRQLTAGEIVDQVYRARALLAGQSAPDRPLQPERAAGAATTLVEGGAGRISNLVFMGMGEPLANLDNLLGAVDILCTDIGANFSPRRITVSTAGLVPKIRELGERAPQLGLAVSLHATTDEVRSRIIPLNRRYGLAQLIAALQRFPLPRRRRITIEYMLIGGLNHSQADARLLPRLLERIPAKVNLLPYNPCRQHVGHWRRPSDEQVEAFADALRARGLNTTIRQSRGLDIDAACGQLATRTET